MDLVEQKMQEMSSIIAEEIDFEILTTLLVEACGWTKVIRSPFVSNKEAVDIRCWLEENCKGHYKSLGYTWVFESEKEALMFTLRWST